MNDCLLMYAASYSDSNMLYATGFLAPDPFIFIQANGRKVMVASDLEYGRARAQARVDEVVPHTEVERKLRARGVERPTNVDVIVHLLKEFGASQVTVPENFWTGVADELREKGIQVNVRRGVFFEQRAIKTKQEVEHITASLRVAEEAIQRAVDILRESSVDGNRIVWQGETLTSEGLRNEMNAHMVRRDCFPSHTIVAGGDQACDPHHRGSGPLPAHKPIVLDVFPRSLETMYWGDITRTVLKGKASPELKKLYDAVLRGQELGCSRVRDGADGTSLHKEIVQFFDSLGYKTEMRDGKPVGFIHGTGHGLGLDIHEAPSIGRRGTTLKAGHVVTVEPGLYYPGLGGIRIEDDVLVEASGCLNLTRFPKFLQIE